MKRAALLVCALLAIGCKATLPDCGTCPPMIEILEKTTYVREPAPELPVPDQPPITSAVSDEAAAADPEEYQRSLLTDLEAWVRVALEAIGIIEDSNATRPADPGNNGG